MNRIFKDELDVVDNLPNQEAKIAYLTSILRSLLHTVSVAIMELTARNVDSDITALDDLIRLFRTPSDGMPHQIVDTLLPSIRSELSPRLAYGWFETRGSRSNISLSRKVGEWVSFRNDRPGHGVIDVNHTEEWAPRTRNIILECLNVFEDLLPRLNANKELRFSKNLGGELLQTPVQYMGHAIVIRSITQRKTGWRLQGQKLCRQNAETFFIPLPEDNLFACIEEPKLKYTLKEIVTDTGSDIVEHNIPRRQTESFSGRERELVALKEWLNDEDSRRCMIFGDGGYGKTTLLLEFLNRYLEGDIPLPNNKPTLLCYYTAKMTRWSADGLAYLGNGQPIVDECIRKLMEHFHPKLSKDWYTTSGDALIDKAKNILVENKLTRDDVLLIVDNTETLVSDIYSGDELARTLNQIGRQLARVIITSRRQEQLEATSIRVEGLTESDSIKLLNDVANDYSADAILKAGHSTLKRIAKQMLYKPLLMEALVIYIARAKTGIDHALEIMYKKSDRDLLEFLYEDAWERLDEPQKHVFCLAISITRELNSTSIAHACKLIEIPHGEFLNCLKETHFANSTDYGSYYEIEMVELAKRFFEKKMSELEPTTKETIQKFANKVDEYVKKREEIEVQYKDDRVAEAFRNEWAKAAKVAADAGDLSGAKENYELAIEDDPCNSALHDRFAWFLANRMNDLDEARSHAEKAVNLNPENCDAVVTLAIINFRLGDILSGDSLIDKAQKLGRPESFCLLQKGISRYQASRKTGNMRLKEALLESAKDLLSLAERRHSSTFGYGAKNLSDIVKYKNLVLRYASGLKQKNRLKSEGIY